MKKSIQLLAYSFFMLNENKSINKYGIKEYLEKDLCGYCGDSLQRALSGADDHGGRKYNR